MNKIKILGIIRGFEKSDDKLITLGHIRLMKENVKEKSWCGQNDEEFDYHGVSKALCGKVYYRDCFVPKRILVIQMK